MKKDKENIKTETEKKNLLKRKIIKNTINVEITVKVNTNISKRK
jgi:hypothetical protein